MYMKCVIYDYEMSFYAHFFLFFFSFPFFSFSFPSLFLLFFSQKWTSELHQNNPRLFNLPLPAHPLPCRTPLPLLPLPFSRQSFLDFPMMRRRQSRDDDGHVPVVYFVPWMVMGGADRYDLDILETLYNSTYGKMCMIEAI